MKVKLIVIYIVLICGLLGKGVDYNQFLLKIKDKSYHIEKQREISLTYKNNTVNSNIIDLLHEYGHYIDNILVGDDKSREEFYNEIDKCMILMNKRIIKPKLPYSFSELKDLRLSPIQDTINVLSNGRFRYYYYHPKSYVENNLNIIRKEVFAQLYTLYIIGDKEQVDIIEKLYPNLFKSFVEMISKNKLEFRK